MSLSERAGRIVTRRRAPWLAALIALLASLPTLFTLPPTDRDESRFAEASAQMLTSGDFTNILFQDVPRYKKPVGIYWAQAASAAVFERGDHRQIWAYRLPSVLGAMLAAAACAWGALAFLEPLGAFAAGGLLAATMVLSTESTLATTDAALCGAVTLAMAAMGRIYLAARDGPPAPRFAWLWFWLGVAASALLKGIGPLVPALAVAALWAWDRRVDWLRGLRPIWGAIVFAAVVLPWALAITVTTDGGFWGVAVGGDLAPKLFGGQEGHGAPPGYFLLLSPILLFPATLLLPAGLALGWQASAEPAIRFALCWLVPSWLMFEIVPTKLPHYTLPCFGALAWLMAAALARPIEPRWRWTGAWLVCGVAVALILAASLGAPRFGAGAASGWAIVVAALLAITATCAIFFMGRRRPALAAALVCGFGLAGHAALAGGLAPSLTNIWLSQRLAKAVQSDPDDLADGPVAVAGYAEPSLVFALGAPTVLGDASDAADAIDDGRLAIVEQHEDAAFRKALAAAGDVAKVAAVVSGLDYSTGHAQILRLYEPVETPEAKPPEPNTQEQP
jgi:4-amino-4-deoxy-L-arabinose transferase-like glycosyltransferase